MESLTNNLENKLKAQKIVDVNEQGDEYVSDDDLMLYKTFPPLQT